eukprot:359720-Chlamydomonas_euryale.AAC.1
MGVDWEACGLGGVAGRRVDGKGTWVSNTTRRVPHALHKRHHINHPLRTRAFAGPALSDLSNRAPSPSVVPAVWSLQTVLPLQVPSQLSDPFTPCSLHEGRYASENVNKLLVGNKSDLESKKVVDSATAKVWVVDGALGGGQACASVSVKGRECECVDQR